jgi:hypothetical protein
VDLSEVRNLNLPFPIEQDIARLHRPMQQSKAMCKMKPKHNSHNRSRFRGRRPPRRRIQTNIHQRILSRIQWHSFESGPSPITGAIIGCADSKWRHSATSQTRQLNNHWDFPCSSLGTIARDLRGLRKTPIAYSVPLKSQRYHLNSRSSRRR